MFTENMVSFKEALHHPFTPALTLDLTTFTLKEYIDLNKTLLAAEHHPVELILDFGDTPLPEGGLAAIIPALISPHISPGLTLCFWHATSLSEADIKPLMSILCSKAATTHLSIYLCADNLAKHDLFAAFVDVFTSTECSPLVYVDFCCGEFEDEQAIYIDAALMKAQYPMGLMIHTPIKSDVIQEADEQSRMAALDYLFQNQLLFSPHHYRLLTRKIQKKGLYENINRALWTIFSPDAAPNFHQPSLIEIQDHDDLEQVIKRLQTTKQALALTLEINTQLLSDARVIHLFRHLKSLYRLSLYFHYDMSHPLLEALICALNNHQLPVGVTIGFKGENLEHHLLTTFFHALTNHSCIPGLTIDFSYSKLKPGLIDKLLTLGTLPIGSWIELGKNGTPEQRESIAARCLASMSVKDFQYEQIGQQYGKSAISALKGKIYARVHQCEDQYRLISSVQLFEQKLVTNKVRPGLTLDLQTETSGGLLRLNNLFATHVYPNELTIDFANQRISEQFIGALNIGLTVHHHIGYGLNLYFWSGHNLNDSTIQAITTYLITYPNHIGLTLGFSGKNLQASGELVNFIDAITSIQCMPWLTIDIHGFSNDIDAQTITYLITKMREQQYPAGLMLEIGGNGTPLQRYEIYSYCYQSTQKGIHRLKHDQNNETLSADILHFLSQRMEANKARACDMQIQLARHMINEHIFELKKTKTLLNNKSQRIHALQGLLQHLTKEMFREKNMGEIIEHWKNTLDEPSGYRYGDLIEARKIGFFHHENTTTSLIHALKTPFIQESKPIQCVGLCSSDSDQQNNTGFLSMG